MDKVSVIVVSYNTKELLDRCLKSIGNTAEIIVADNASTDGSVEMIRKKYPLVKLIINSTNIGFGAANNLGMRAATGDYFLLLNSDAFLEKDTLKKCLDYLEKNSADVIGCKLTYADGRLQPSAGFLPNPFNTFLWVFGIDTLPLLNQIIPSIHPKYPEFFARNHPVGWVTGAFMFMRRQVFDKTGGFDEKYFMYTEEVDWCKRMHDAGLSIHFVADFSVVHLYAASSKFSNRNATVREMQGMVYYFQKHYPRITHLMKFILWTGNLTRAIAFTLVGNRERAGNYKEVVRSL